VTTSEEPHGAQLRNSTEVPHLCCFQWSLDFSCTLAPRDALKISLDPDIGSHPLKWSKQINMALVIAAI